MTAELQTILTFEVMLILMALCFITAIISAIFGMIGGVIVVVIGTIWVPFDLWLPIHACIQFVSNASRVYIGRNWLDYKNCFDFAKGNIFGNLLGTYIIFAISRPVVVVICNIFILLSTWTKMISFNFKFGMPLLGLVQGFLGGMIGATGPLAMPTLIKMYQQQKNTAYEKIVINNSGVMVVGHLFRLIAFAIWGFSYISVWQPIAIFCTMAFFGTFVGSKIRSKITKKEKWVLVLKIALTLLVCTTIYRQIS